MTRDERIDKESDLKFRRCLRCRESFLYPFQAKEHAKATGHDVEQNCQAEHPRTQYSCLREINHPGKHAYVGSQYTVFF